MTYRPVSSEPRDELLAIATERWEAIRARRPDLGPAVDLQRRLLAIVIDLSDAVDHARLPRLTLPPKYLAAKLERGVPALAGEPIPLPVAALTGPLLELCRELAAGGAGESADHIREAIENGSLEAGSLLAASLSRDQQAIRTGAVHRGLAPDLVWLIGELAVSPFAHALQRTVLHDEPSPAGAGAGSGSPGSHERLTAALQHWDRGFCPACGSWPALAEVVGGHRLLRCSFCAAAWELGTYACVYCHESGDAFATAAPDADRPDRRLELCSACRSYLKTVDLATLSPFPLLAIADLETMDLDLAAMERGFARPPLKDFGIRK